ncbi:MAG TPA: flagellar hook-associated protein FlgK [Candidatus Krumholzibacteria bacterium]|nr:flagellar hook-associated protein FlgK [Candidatus Krumholzibacteria bacterium]HPD71655.1 flagellar hook-associated protein FlgK [Candidatus Krumholzibacteria bacterium]HRY41412.1 flagellar hook-associated protein FlgK [Candidatus Krumholzibacteria bacterium]
MSSLATVMDSSLSAMFAAQAGLATTSHNIANADTDGYTRQSNLLAARRPLLFPFGAIGQGVDVLTIRRSQDTFLLNSLRSQQSKLAAYASVDSALCEIENILGSLDNDHLGDALNEFFGAWSDLATAPTDPSLKQQVVSKAVSLVTDFHTISASFDDLGRTIESQVQEEIGSLNSLLTQVADLNSQIMAAEIGGQPANDLRDQRDVLVNDISQIAAVGVEERSDGSLDVIINGRTMVTRGSAQQFTTTYRETGRGYEMVVVTSGNFHEVQLPEGRLAGLLESRDVYATGIRAKLDAVAKLLIDAVNELHVQGTTGSSSGLMFFSGDSLHTIQLNEMLIAQPELVATSRSGEAGDTDIARAIAALADTPALGGSLTVGDSYRGVLIDVASKRSSFEFLVENQDSAVAAVEAKIASVTGVSLDEEAANMVRYQNTYNAAAKIIATVQELYETLVNMV